MIMTKGVLRIILVLGLLVAWRRGAAQLVTEWMRRLSDIPTNAILTGTSGFEQEGRDPSKRD